MAKVMAAGGEKRVMGWLWQPVGGDQAHPAETPKDEVAATKRWRQNVRGPRLARITLVNVMVEKKSSKPNHLFIMHKESLKEVPKHLVLHEREGFLIIQELIRRHGDAAFLSADWLDGELRAKLDKASAGRILSSSQYVNKVLIRKAVTGVKYVDDKGRESSYRRDMLEKEDDNIPAGEEADGYFCIKEIVEYMPPWEAFCDTKCGFYQDFYKVRWADPYSEIDYAHVENGCAEPGCTWEPDENLPPCLDSLRIKTKKAWFAAQSDREAQGKRAGLEQGGDAKRLRSITDVKKEVTDVKKEEDEEETKKIELTQRKRDNAPLEGDVFLFHLGHDLVPESQVAARFPNVKKGWPLHPKDYPTGFGVASPPGFCWEGCDCMDDQRGQSTWEVTKSWIPRQRGVDAQAALDQFSGETNFVRSRGAVSKMFYFETSTSESGEAPAQRACAELATTIQGCLREACIVIPAHALSSANEPLYLPARAIISTRGNGDYLPLSIEANLENGGALPSWIKLDAATGCLSISPGHKVETNVRIQIHLKFYEGTTKTFSSTIAAGDGESPPLRQLIGPIIEQLAKPVVAKLDPGIRAILNEQLAIAADSSLGKLVKILSRCQNLLRATSVANLLSPGALRRSTT